MIKAIFACDEQGGIGKDNTMPWPHNKADMQWFKNATSGHIVVMGSSTWNSEGMPKPLPRRTNYVFSSQDPSEFVGAETLCGDVVSFLKMIQDNNPGLHVWVIGGAKLLEQANDVIEEYYISRIPGVFDCDTSVDVDSIVSECESIHWDQQLDGTKFEIWKRK